MQLCFLWWHVLPCRGIRWQLSSGALTMDSASLYHVWQDVSAAVVGRLFDLVGYGDTVPHPTSRVFYLVISLICLIYS